MNEPVTLTESERLVYAAAFAAYLEGADLRRSPGGPIATSAAIAAMRAVQDLRMAATHMDPNDHDERYAQAMLAAFRAPFSKPRCRASLYPGHESWTGQDCGPNGARCVLLEGHIGPHVTESGRSVELTSDHRRRP